MKKAANFLDYHIRRWYTQVDEALANESGVLAEDGVPVRKVVVAAAIQNPYAGEGYSDDLSKIVNCSKELGAEFGRRLVQALAGDSAQSYGKACLVGAEGEYEHGNGFLTTSFANPIREALGGGSAWIPSTGKRSEIGGGIDVPLACKDALYVRSHYDTITVNFPDSPAPDEVVVIFAIATRGRIKARLGGLTFDQVEGKDGLR
ncbi:amino acid synthesis family protein [Pelagicoccus albus]|uniref:Amino acid synthesis family protein n=1 Tax=Pelagicoccus albus TaxID=415222 RepID=A0A7X1EBJ4_9BACT|nr:amino acid synthesis family protein [Pelagicoccus albus]MBC2607882.1 amino acid synthesis family protein [Pelagicoccus albus]